MKKEFIKINDSRIKINCIKKYKPVEDNRLYVYYNTSRTNVAVEIFTMANKKQRNAILKDLDIIFGIE